MSDAIIDTLAERFGQSALKAEQYTDYNQLKNTPEFIDLQKVIRSEHPNSKNREDFSKHRQMVTNAFSDLKSKISRVVSEEIGKIHAVQQEVQNRVRALEKASKNDKGHETQLALVYARSYEKSYMFATKERPFVTEEIFARLDNYQSHVIQSAIDHEARHFEGLNLKKAWSSQLQNNIEKTEAVEEVVISKKLLKIKISELEKRTMNRAALIQEAEIEFDTQEELNNFPSADYSYHEYRPFQENESAIKKLEREISGIERQLSDKKSAKKLKTTQAQREHEAAEAEKQRQHEDRQNMIELEKERLRNESLKEQRLAAEAARDAAAIAKAQESEQFATILRSLKDDEG